MTRLERFLYANAQEYAKSDTTNSRYFILDKVTVRLSDHISTQTTSDIQIIIPTNKTIGLYTVVFGDNGKVLIWTNKQIQEFLPSLILMKEMTTKSVKPKDPNKLLTSVQKIELAKQTPKIGQQTLQFNKLIDTKIQLKYASAAERAIISRSKSPWTTNEMKYLPQMFYKEFTRGDSINDDFQIFLNCTSVDYCDAINLYKIIVIDNNQIPTIALLQEAYQLIK